MRRFWGVVGRRFRPAALVIVFGVAGCLHRSRQLTLLEPLRPKYERMFADSMKAEYLSFADRQTEALLRPVTRGGRYKFVSRDTALFCQSYPGSGKQGYRVDSRQDNRPGRDCNSVSFCDKKSTVGR